MKQAIEWTNCKVKLGDLTAWSRNPRMSSKAQAKRLLESWDKFGQVMTVAISPDGEVYDGHQRLSALLTLHGKDYKIDARRASRKLTDKERRELVITLHSGAVGEWSWDELANWNAPDLIEWGMDTDMLKSLKTDIGALGNLIESEKPEIVDAEVDTDRAAELNKKWGVKRGDMFSLTSPDRLVHKLLCGDSTSAEDVARLMQGEKAGACVTDPPWNVGWKYESYKDNLTPEQYKDFSDAWRRNAESVVDNNAVFFVAMSMKNYKHFSLWFPTAERIFAECQNFVQHTGGFMQYAFNPILVWELNKGKEKSAAGQRDYFLAETSITRSTPDKELAKLNTATRWLPTIKYIVDNFTNGIVYDPFGGSGTTMVACNNLGRVCMMIELDPKYCSVILQRMSDAFPDLTIEQLE